MLKKSALRNASRVPGSTEEEDHSKDVPHAREDDACSKMQQTIPCLERASCKMLQGSPTLHHAKSATHGALSANSKESYLG